MKVLGRVLCVLLSVVCAVLFALTSAAALGLYGLRSAVTEDSVTSLAEGMDFAAIRFPDGFGGFTTVPEQMNTAFSPYGYSITDEGFNSLCRELSFDRILAGYLRDFRAWLFDYGPTPVFDPDKAAETIAESMNPGALSFFRDPVSFISSMLTRFLSFGDLSSRLDSLAPLRDYLSADALRFVCSAALICLTLLWISRRLKILPTLTIAGFSLAAAGALLFFAPRLFAPFKNRILLALTPSFPESTFDLLYLPVMKSISRLGYRVLVIALAAACLAGLGWILTAAVRRSRKVPATPVPPEAVQTNG